MLSQNSRLRAMKSLLYSYYVDFKSFYGIYIGIMTGLLLSKLALSSSASGSSSLGAGLVNGMFMLPIAMIIITSNSELLKKFSFHVDRNMLVFSHIILILVLPVIMLLTSCGFHLLETLAAEIALTATGNFFYTWVITKDSFLVGFALSYIIMVCVGGITWMVFAWFYRHKIATSVVCGTFLLALIYLRNFRDAFLNLINLIVYSPSPGMLFLKFSAITLISFAVGYIPIKRMEVK